MRPLQLFLLLASAFPLWAAPPLHVQVESASLLNGPGKEPPPGAAPFRPRIQAQVALKGLKAGAMPEFRLWRIPESAVKGLRKARLVRKGVPGATRIEGTVLPLGTEGLYSVQAPADAPLKTRECLVVEVLVKGRWAGRGFAPIHELNLPTSRPRQAETDS